MATDACLIVSPPSSAGYPADFLHLHVDEHNQFASSGVQDASQGTVKSIRRNAGEKGRQARSSLTETVDDLRETGSQKRHSTFQSRLAVHMGSSRGSLTRSSNLQKLMSLKVGHVGNVDDVEQRYSEENATSDTFQRTQSWRSRTRYFCGCHCFDVEHTHAGEAPR